MNTNMNFLRFAVTYFGYIFDVGKYQTTLIILFKQLLKCAVCNTFYYFTTLHVPISPHPNPRGWEGHICRSTYKTVNINRLLIKFQSLFETSYVLLYRNICHGHTVGLKPPPWPRVVLRPLKTPGSAACTPPPP